MKLYAFAGLDVLV